MITAKQVNKTFGSTAETVTRVLKDIDLSIRPSEIVSIMGPSGCGKTTLLHILSGIELADSGEITVANTHLHKLKDKPLSNFRLHTMGFVFQTYHLIPVLTAIENVELPLIARGFSRSAAQSKAAFALKQVGLADKANEHPSRLSGGQSQRVAIARAIAGDSKVIWADEPTGALDSDSSEQIIGLMRMLNETLGTTIVIVTHDPIIAAHTSRIIRMDNGRIVDHGINGQHEQLGEREQHRPSEDVNHA